MIETGGVVEERIERATARARRRPFAARLALAALDLYALATTLYLVGRLAVGDRLWPVAAGSVVAHWLLLPALPLFPLALRLRRAPTAGMLALGGVAFVWLFGGLFVPRPTPPTDGEPFRVMTFNTANAATLPGPLVERLRAADAEIAAIVELTDRQAAAIERDLADRYPYFTLYPGGAGGKGLVSRYPIRDAELLTFASDRRHLHATIEPPDRPPLTVIVAHPPPPNIVGLSYWIDPDAAADIRAIAAFARANAPAIVLGDFNFTDQSDNYTLLARAGLHDAWREAGFGFGSTWPLRDPRLNRLPALVRIDYVWHTGELATLDAHTGYVSLSDHVSVHATLGWRR